MDKKTLRGLILAVLIGIPVSVGHANEQVAADLFSNSVRAALPEITSDAVQVSEASETKPAADTLNFLSQEALENTDSPSKPLPKTAIHFLTGIDIDQLTSPVSLEKQLEGVEIPVSVLVFEKCITTGDEINGSSQCEWRYSSGFKSTLVSHHSHDGEKKVSHIVMTENDRGGSWQGKRDVLHTTTLENGKVASEVYDITYDLGLSPGESAARESARTREVLRYNYNTQTAEKTLKDMSWIKYADTREGGLPRDMEYHAVLTYDEHGRPRRGLAAQWSSGWKANTLFDWQSQKDIPDVSSRELWQMWEQWIKNGPAHVFIV